MTASVASPYSEEQITVWLRGLLTIAWADGNFDEDEKALISAITEEKLAPKIQLKSFEPIDPEDLAKVLGQDQDMGENFLRTAVMVALADGVYSAPEDKILQTFCEALQLKTEILESLRLTLYDQAAPAASASPLSPPHKSSIDPMKPAREWLDQLDVQDPQLARFLCKLIPSQCPFERDITLFGQKLVHIPPMCKLNPLYEQLVGLRFKALSYLADDCGEDVTPFL